MNRYLEEAAALLRKVAADNEKTDGGPGWSRSQYDINQGRERIAMKFAQLGAIEAGLIPAEMIQDLLAAAALRESQ
jgi:hypothetical protein